MQSNWKRDFNSHSQFNMSANCMNLFYWNKWQGEVIMHIVMIQNECLDHRKKNYKRISNVNMKDSSERWKKKKVHYYWKELLSNNSFSAFAKIMEPCNSQNTNGKNFFMLYYGSGKNQKALEYLMNSFFFYFNGRYHLHVSTIIEDWREGKYSKIRTNKWSIQIFLSLYKT